MPPRPKRQLISRDDVARAALSIIDADGLTALNLDRIADVLGVKAPSLYYHFKDKQAILSYTASRIVEKAHIPPDLPTHLTLEWLVQTCTALRSEILRHPNAVSLLVSHFPRRVLTDAFERMSERLVNYGTPPELHLMIFEGMERLVLGSAVASATRAQEGHSEDELAADPERHPVLDQALRANPWNEEELFAETLRRFLIGALQADEAPAATRVMRA
jgi:AcrR family transcriptional regulator